jgi:hypothetical protein
MSCVASSALFHLSLNMSRVVLNLAFDQLVYRNISLLIVCVLIVGSGMTPTSSGHPKFSRTEQVQLPLRSS